MKINNATTNELLGGQSSNFETIGRQQDRQMIEPKTAKDSKEAGPEELQKAVDKLQGKADLANGAIEFSTDQDTGKRVVKVVDKATHDILMQIPSKVALAMAQDVDKTNGLLVNQKA